jgi:hypothetical protein
MQCMPRSAGKSSYGRFVLHWLGAAYVCAAGHAAVALALQRPCLQPRQDVVQWNAGIVTT